MIGQGPTIRACLLAAVVATSGAHLAGCCSAEGCEDYMAISGTLERPAFQPLHLQVVACRGDACGEATLDSEVIASGDDSTSTLLLLDGGGSFDCEITRKPESCTPGETCGGGGAWELQLTLEKTDIEDGEDDTYNLVVVDSDSGETLVDMTESVTYVDAPSDSAICGRDCQVGEIRFTSADSDG